ncbi:MAG: thioredoxin family protein [Fuerstiella sp.]
MLSFPSFGPAVLIAGLLLGGGVFAAETPGIGDPAPGWKDLAGTDDQKYSLKSFSEADALIVCFTCNSCPYAVDYEERMIALQRKYADASVKVQLVAINSNAVPADSMPRMKERAAERKFNFPYLRDESQDVARAYGAVYTPEFYVLNRKREIVYRGAMDDSTAADRVTVNYIDLAVEAALQDKLPEVTTTGARGCTIRFKRSRR